MTRARPSYGSTSAPRRASARPTRCSTRGTGGRARGTDVVVGFVETHGRPRTAEHARRPGGHPAAQSHLPRAPVHRDGPRRRAGPRARRSRWSTSWPTPTCPASRTPSAGRTIEELLDAGIDVSPPSTSSTWSRSTTSSSDITGVPQRETVPDAVVRARRAGRTGRHDPGGAAPPDGARQHLPARTRSTRRCPTTSGPATSPRCASWRCCGSPTGSRRSCSATASNTESPPPGRPASGSWSR